MRLSLWKTVPVMALTMAMVLSVPDAAGQARSRRRTARLTSPGRLGRGNPSNEFRVYSFGVGTLQRSSPGGNVLGSSIRRGASYNLRRPRGGSAGAGLSQTLAPKRTGIQLKPAGGPAISLPGPTTPSPVTPTPLVDSPGLAGLGSAMAYVREVEQRSITSLGIDGEEITSLAPDEPSQYRDFMIEGEKALRTGEYREAEKKFRLAMKVRKRSPECMLDMVHALLGSSRYSYAQAAYYLRRTIAYFPALALVPLKPKAFFAGEDEYRRVLGRLETYVRTYRQDGDAQFVLAYFRWFDGDVEGARSALELATRHTPESEKSKLEAIQAFRDGMAAGDEAPGQVGATTQPADGSAEGENSGTGAGTGERTK